MARPAERSAPIPHAGPDGAIATLSGEPRRPVYRPEDLDGLDPAEQLGDAGRVPVHARRVPVDVPRAAVDDAAVRRVRHGRRDERALPVPARAGQGGLSVAFDMPTLMGLDSDDPRCRGRGRPLRRGDRLARRLRDAVRRHPARRHLDVDDDQRPGGRGVRVLPGDGRAAGRAVGATRRHAADRHLQGVHRAEGVDLPAAARTCG